MNKRMISNAFWIMSEKLVAVFGLIFVTSFVAKYVGPEIFGEIAFATSIFQLMQIIAQMGSDVIIFKRMSSHPKSGVKLTWTTSWLRLAVFAVLCIPFIIFTSYRLGEEGIYFVFACCLSCLFTTLDVYNFFFDAKLESKKNTLINVIGLVISLIIRWGIAWFSLEPVWLCVPIVLTGLVPYLLRKYLFSREVEKSTVVWKHQVKYAKYLFFSGMTFVISTISVALYTRLSMMGLEFIKGHESVGIFSVAASLAGAWSFVFNAFMTSFLPSIFAENDHEQALNKTANLNVVIILLALPIFFIVYFATPYFISYFYGPSYVNAYIPLLIISVSTMLSALGNISGRFIAKYSGYAFLSKKTLAVLLTSIIMNFPLIYFYGIYGAAFATLATELFSLTVFNYFFRNGPVFKLHVRTFRINIIRLLCSSYAKVNYHPWSGKS